MKESKGADIVGQCSKVRAGIAVLGSFLVFRLVGFVLTGLLWNMSVGPVIGDPTSAFGAIMHFTTLDGRDPVVDAVDGFDLLAPRSVGALEEEILSFLLGFGR